MADAKIEGYSSQNQFEIGGVYLYRLDADGEVPSRKQWLDIKAVIEEINIYEDILSPTISADILIIDSFNIPDKFLVVGGERVRIEYKTATLKEMEELDFVIYKVGERNRAEEISKDASKVQSYWLKLCTPDKYLDANIDLSKAYKGTYEDIVKSLVKELDDGDCLMSIPTMGIQTFIAPYWSPLKCIKWCASRAIDENLSPFFFYEDMYQYNFLSLKFMYDQEPYKTLYIESKANYANIGDPEKAFNTILKWEYMASNDKLKQYSAGALGTDVYTMNMKAKTVTKSKFDYSENFDKNDISVEYNELYDDMKALRNKTTFVMEREDNSHLGEVYKQSLMNTMDNYRLKVMIPGDSLLRAGYIVELDIPSLVGGAAYIPEKTTSGRWFIASLRHIIRRNKYTMVLELTKDSFAVDIAGKLTNG